MKTSFKSKRWHRLGLFKMVKIAVQIFSGPLLCKGCWLNLSPPQKFGLALCRRLPVEPQWRHRWGKNVSMGLFRQLFGGHDVLLLMMMVIKPWHCISLWYALYFGSQCHLSCLDWKKASGRGVQHSQWP